MDFDKIDSFMKNRCRGKKVKQPFGKKNACDEAEGLESATKCYHRCNRPDFGEVDEVEQR